MGSSKTSISASQPGLGILVSSALGAGLMALMFYSNRSGIDEKAWRPRKGRTRKNHPG